MLLGWLIGCQRIKVAVLVRKTRDISDDDYLFVFPAYQGVIYYTLAKYFRYIEIHMKGFQKVRILIARV